MTSIRSGRFCNLDFMGVFFVVVSRSIHLNGPVFEKKKKVIIWHRAWWLLWFLMAYFHVSHCHENALRSCFMWADLVWQHQHSVTMCGRITAWTHGSIYGSCVAVDHDLVHIEGCASVIRLAKQGCAKDVERRRERGGKRLVLRCLLKGSLL